MIPGIVSSQTRPSIISGVAWNPSDKHADITLTNSNLTATNASVNQWRVVRATMAHNSGKRYFEGRRDVSGNDDELATVGLATLSSPLTQYLGGGTGAAYSAGYYVNGRVWQNAIGGSTNTLLPISDGEWAGLAVDFDTGEAWVRDSTGWYGDPEAGTGSVISFTASITLFAAASLYSTGDKVTANFGGSSFAYAVPSGFLAWNA